MYHVVTIGIVSLILYLLTLAGSRYGIISRRQHRIFWNIILLITFIVTAGAGIFLALHSNYKWDIEGIEKLLNWHVEFGTGMSFTALIHLSWHLQYYYNIFKKNKVRDEGSLKGNSNSQLPCNPGLLLIMLGFLSGAIQVIFLREILNLSGGYEIIAGTVFAVWIIISAAGARLAGNNSNFNLNALAWGLPLSAVLSFVILILLSRLLTGEGVIPGYYITLLITTISLLPFCTISAYLFVKLSYFSATSRKITAGSSFATETAGSMISGILITLLAGSVIDNYQLVIASVLLYIIILGALNGRKRYAIYSVAASLVLVAALITDPDTGIRNIILDSVKIARSKDSQYGNIAVSNYGGEESIFYNHRLVSYEQNIKQREENIHYAMLQHENPVNILLISGGLNNHLPELRKYKTINSITYLERDPELLAMTSDIKDTVTEADINVISDDAYSFVRKTHGRYDVIISLLSEPDNIVSSRFYSTEFFSNIKRILTEKGIFMLRAGVASSYLSKEQTGVLSSVYNTLKDNFTEILPIKGESVYLICSSGDLSVDIPGIAEKRGIENSYVNRYYLSKDIINYNSLQISELTDSTISKNSLNRPVVVFYSQKHQMLKAGNGRIIFPVIAGLILLLPFFAGSRKSRTMYSSSLNLAGTEIMALILIQSTAGNIYQLAGLLIAITMAGLAIGSYFGIFRNKRAMQYTAPALGLSAIFYAFISAPLLDMENVFLSTSLSLIIVFIPAVLAGSYYRSATLKSKDSLSISSVYFADLCGAALGFLIIASVLVPLFGIKTTFLILAFINFASYITGQLSIIAGKVFK